MWAARICGNLLHLKGVTTAKRRGERGSFGLYTDMPKLLIAACQSNLVRNKSEKGSLGREGGRLIMHIRMERGNSFRGGADREAERLKKNFKWGRKRQN